MPLSGFDRPPVSTEALEVDTRSEFTALRIKIPSLVLANANTQACPHVHQPATRFIDTIEAYGSAAVPRGRAASE